MKSHKQFVKDLDDSQRHVAAVVDWMTKKRYKVKALPQTVSPDYESRYEHQDSGDIELRCRVEVKGRNINFSGREDYPFATVFIDELYKIPSVYELFAYAICSADGGCIAMVYNWTREHWLEREKFDRVAGRSAIFMEIPKEYVAFYPVEGGGL